MTRKHYGVEEAHRRLPELLEKANRGAQVVITKHGKRYATFVSGDAVAALGRGKFARLRGSGAGLWRPDAASFVEQLRNEW